MQTKNKPSQKIIHVLLLLMFLFGTAAVRFSDQKSVSAQSGNTILAESTFDTTTEGWGIINDGSAPAYHATDGMPGGYISSTDKGSGTYWYWKAPAEFLGNKSAAYGGDLSFFLRQNNITNQKIKDDVLLEGGGYTLVYTLPSYPGTSWSSYTISLIETASNWKNKTTGIAPTQAQMQAVLANLLSIKIRGEYEYGPDTGGIDSVYLHSAPFTPTPTLTSTPTATATFTPTYTPIPTDTSVPGPTATTGCYGDTCNELNPFSTGCYLDAESEITKPLYDSNNVKIGEVQNRYSITCLAQWEKTLNMTDVDLYAEGSIRWGYLDYTPHMHPVSGITIIANDEISVYTAMYGVDAGLGPSLNCGSLSTSPITPPSPPTTPIALNSSYGLNNCVSR